MRKSLTHWCGEVFFLSVTSVSEVLKRLATAIDYETTLHITVHRSSVWIDALREAQKQSFCSFLFCLRYVYFALQDKDDIMPHQVTFFGESSIDVGDPQREFFRLLVLQAGESLLRGQY